MPRVDDSDRALRVQRVVGGADVARDAEAATALLLLSPFVPMLFMGEEWGATDPFLYFTSHNDELAKLVREGRRADAAAAYRRALELAGTEPERAFLAARVRELTDG